MSRRRKNQLPDKPGRKPCHRLGRLAPMVRYGAARKVDMERIENGIAYFPAG